VAVTQPLVQPGGSTVTPGVSRLAGPAYTDPLISRSPGGKAPPRKPRGAALALVAASIGASAVAASASSAGARQRLRTCQGRWVIAGRTSSVRPVPCGAGAAHPAHPARPFRNERMNPFLTLAR
jgi:hypothetical protein